MLLCTVLCCSFFQRKIQIILKYNKLFVKPVKNHECIAHKHRSFDILTLPFSYNISIATYIRINLISIVLDSLSLDLIIVVMNVNVPIFV